MEGSVGNPGPASSQRLPDPPDNDTLQTTDWASMSEEDNKWCGDSVCPTTTEKHLKAPGEKHKTPAKKSQRPEDKDQSLKEKLMSSKEKLKSPKERLQSHAKKTQSPEDKDQCPKERFQGPKEKLKSPKERLQTPKEKHQSPKERLQSPEDKLKSPKERLQCPEEKHQSPKERLQSPEEKHQTPKERLHSPKKRLQTPEEKHQSPEEKPQSPEDNLQCPKERPKSPARKHLNTPEEKLQSSKQRPQSPTEGPQSPEEQLQQPEETAQSPARKHLKTSEEESQSPKKNHQSSVTSSLSHEEKPKLLKEKPQCPKQRLQIPKVIPQSPKKKPKSPEKKPQSPEKEPQSPAEKPKRPERKLQSLKEKLERPEQKRQSPEEKDQRPKESPEQKAHIPVRKAQSPGGKPQSPLWTPQSPVRTPQSQEEKTQTPKRTPQSPKESMVEGQQDLERAPAPYLNTEKTCPSAQLNTEQTPHPAAHLNSEQPPSSPAHLTSDKTHPPPAHLNTQQTPPPVHFNTEKTLSPAHLDTKQTSSLPAHLNTEQSPPPAHLNTEQTPPPAAHLNSEQTPSPPAHLNTEQTSPLAALLNSEQPPSPPAHLTSDKTHPPPAHLNTQQTPPPVYMNTEKTLSPVHLDTKQTSSPPAHLDIEQSPPPAHLNTEQTPPPPVHLNTEQTPPTPPAQLKAEQTPSLAHLNTKQTPPAHPNTEQTPPPAQLNTEQTPPPPAHLNTKQTPPPAHLNTEQTPPPPAHLNTKQTPPSAHLNTEQTPPPAHLNTEQTPPPAHLNTEQTPPPAHLNTEQTPPPAHLNTEQTPPPPAHLNTEQTPPPPAHLNTEQTPPPPAHLNTEQTPPPAHLNTEQTPPPAHLNSDPAAPPPPVAPPLSMEVHCDQVKPRPLLSSGEPKLCGYLQKQGGPLRTWKQRWFTYEEKKNQLFYYRTPQDVTPLGRVELCSATFTYPLKDERGTFHIKTPERTFILKASTQDLMLYWLQQLQVKRWQHRHSFQDSTNNMDNATDEFLPALKSPLGLVGEEAANTPSQCSPLANMSIKHPLITIQNSVHSLRKRTSQEWTQSVFHIETPPPSQPSASETASTASKTPSEPQALPPPPSLSEQTVHVTPVEASESLFDRSRRRTKTRSSSSMASLRRETMWSERISRLLQEKQMLTEELKAQKELVWILHKALEASQLEKRTCAEFLAATGEQERLELLRHRERQAADLRGRLEDAKAEADAVRRSHAESEARLVDLQETIRLLEEKNDAKQEVVIKLSDQLTTCMLESPGRSGHAVDFESLRQLEQQVEHLKDDLDAYQTQNRFLNSEIQQLTGLWRTSSQQEKSLIVKCAYLEAGNCQMESRYLNVLRQLQEVKALDPEQRAAVQKMIEDALKGELKTDGKLQLNRDYDRYGFKIVPDYEVEDMKLLAKIQALEIRSHNLLHQEGAERPLLARWAQYLAGRSDDDLVPSPELKGLLRSGVPHEYRPQVWRWLIKARTRTIRDQHPDRYRQLCEKSRACPPPACRQIQLDLHRTLTTNKNFSSPSSPALQQLRRILLAFTWQNPAIGYCQGLNRLAALALLVLEDEEEAFWCLVAVVEVIMPQDYYTKTLSASQADQRVLKDFLLEKVPRLAAHFEDFSIDVSLITFNWFLVVFVESLPSDILLPLWDAYLYEGTKVMFRYALALFKYKEEDFLKIRDSVEIYQYLRFFTKTISHSRRLISIAFSDMNPFPSRLLRNRRALHLERLQGELRELEEQQRAFVTQSKHKDKELDTGVSEDDDEL